MEKYVCILSNRCMKFSTISKTKDNSITYFRSAKTCPIIVRSVAFDFSGGKWKYLEVNIKIWVVMYNGWTELCTSDTSCKSIKSDTFKLNRFVFSQYNTLFWLKSVNDLSAFHKDKKLHDFFFQIIWTLRYEFLVFF